MIRRLLRRYLGLDTLEADLVRLRNRVDPLGNYPAEWAHLCPPSYVHIPSGRVVPMPYLTRNPDENEYAVDIRGLDGDQVAVAVRNWMEARAQKMTEGE